MSSNKFSDEECETDLEKLQSLDAKLRYCLDVMEKALSSSHSPNFRLFWNMRSKSMELFKNGGVTHALKGQLWNHYIELTEQARELKKILEEQSSFEIEQLSLAVDALEKDIESLINGAISPKSFGVTCKSLEDDIEELGKLQAKIEQFGTRMTQLDALRNELKKLEMRISVRNKLFKHLSAVGDKLYPTRKEYVQAISNLYSKAVHSFAEKHPLNKEKKPSLIFMRTEIKAFQAIAKLLSLNSQTFKGCRRILSSLWDEIQTANDDLKKERESKKELYQENLKKVLARVGEFSTTFKEGKLTEGDAKKQFREVITLSKELELGFEEEKIVRNEIDGMKSLLNSKEEKADQIRRDKLKKQEKVKVEKVETLKQKITDLRGKCTEESSSELFEKWREINQLLDESKIVDSEKARLKHYHNISFDFLILNKGKVVENTEGYLEELYDWLDSVYNQYESWKKLCGSSGLNFELAMAYNDELSIAKERLQKFQNEVSLVEEKVESKS